MTSRLSSFFAVPLAFLVGFAVVGSSPNASADTAPVSTLSVGGVLQSGESLVSWNAKFTLTMQSDGNLVIYDAFRRPMWNSNTSGRGASNLFLQADGNLVVYNATGATWWSGVTNTDTQALVMQGDGNLVVTTSTGFSWQSNTQLPLGSTGYPDPSVAPSGLANPSILSVGDHLSNGQGITSADGRYSAIMQRDGNFVVYGPFAHVMWSTNTTGRAGAVLYLQPDGNLVLYTSAGVPIFSSGTSGGAFLNMQPDGHLVLYSGDLTPLWYVADNTPTAPPRLYRGEKLLTNQALSSPNGSYNLFQQSDGNLVAYGPGGTPVWSSGTSGSRGAFTSIDASGNLTVKNTDGATLFMSYTTSGSWLAMQNDGNVVISLANGAPVWASQGQVRPMPAFLSDGARQTSVPPTSVSRYIRNLVGAPSDITYWRSRGSIDGAANASGSQYMSLLDIGAQSSTGVLLSASGRYASYGTLVAALNAYVDGYNSTHQSNAPVVIALGTNNDSTSLSDAVGRAWSQQVVNPVAIHASGMSGITIAGANDIEPGFRGSPSSTKAWLGGYLATTGQPFVFNGSADGCSPTKVDSACNNGWRASDLYQLSTGFAPGKMLSLPQIYNSTMSKQWKYISLTGVVAGAPKINFGGALTEVSACAIAGPCASPPTGTAWNYLWSQLNSDSRIVPTTLPWATDLTIN